MRRKSFEECQELYVQALQAGNWNDVAVWATDLLRFDEAQPHLWGNRGIALQRLGHPLDAILNHQRALDYEESVNHYCNLGAAYQDMDKYDKALGFFEKAVSMDDSIPQTHMNIGHSYKWHKDYDKALAAYRKTVEVGPDYVDGHLALAMLLLKMGHLREGWKEYEWRWKSEQLPPRGLRFPHWENQDLNHKSILIYGEQGLGDIIQFGRYVRVLAARYPHAKIIVEGKQQVKRLLQTIPELDKVINYGEKIPHVDYVVAMMTLAGKLTPDINSIPAINMEYLLDPHDVGVWRNKFEDIPSEHTFGKFKVGICWAGMARMNNPMALKVDEVRSIELSDFAGIAKIPEIFWVSLQKGAPADQLRKPPTGMRIADFTEDMYDFYETCCAIENCDLVISVDTAVCHAAASIGKPTWLLSRWDGCWRWLGDRKDSPWYPTLRQFVQPSPHDWNGLLKEVERELQALVKNKRQLSLNLTMAK